MMGMTEGFFLGLKFLISGFGGGGVGQFSNYFMRLLVLNRDFGYSKQCEALSWLCSFISFNTF